jgi:outer membrane receptor protein involved in Fe transport
MKATKFKTALKASSSLITAVALSAALAATASAQDAGTDAPEEDATARLETVTVTSTRRAESIQDVPINIAAVGGDQIEQQGFDDISELAAFVPGLNIIDQGGRSGNRIVVRGLNAEPVSNAFGQANGGGTVATYVGDIPLFVDLRLNDVERVETLLGPQGTLYGAGTMGGAIRYIPNKPNFDGTSFEVRADAYTYSEGDGISSDLGATLNVSLSDSFAVRASVDFLNDDGFIDNPFVVTTPGVSNPDPDFTDPAARAANFSPIEDANTEEVISGRISARWQPTSYLDGTLTYYFQNSENGGRNTSSRRGILQTGDYEFSNRVPEPNERDNELLALEITADLGFAELTSATGLGETTENGQRDQTDLLITLEYSYETFPTFTAFTFEDDKTEVFNQEVRLVSTGDQRYNWIVGAFYNKNEYRALSSEFTPGYVESFGVPLPTSGALEYFEADRTELEEKAIFGEFGYDITPDWDVTVGARFYEYEFQTGNSTSFPVADYLFFDIDGFQPFSLGQIDQNIPLDSSQDFSGELFKVNTSYKLPNGNLLYATFSQGYRVGGPNGGTQCSDTDLAAIAAGNPPVQGLCLFAAGDQFSDNPADIVAISEFDYTPDTVDNYEIGAKTTWLDGALTLNGSIYYIDWQDVQVASTTINAGTSITVNGGEATSTGFDLAGNWQVSDALNVRGSYSFVKAELAQDVSGLVRTITPPGFGTAFEDAQSGDRLPGSPESQFSLFASYVMPLSNGNDVLFDGGYSWQSDVESVVGARGGSFTLPSYGRANAAIGYRTDQWTVTGYIDNIFDELSESSVTSRPAFNQNILGANVRSFRTNVLAPRTVGVRVKYNFQ